MIDVRPFAQLGNANHGWLKARHHFSFAHYHDDTRMHWGDLRVWNDDEITAGGGFPAHPHANMEIITYVRDGAITHEDSMGNRGRTGAGDVQVMSAGTGIRHSEYNLEDETTRIFQIWILPRENGGTPQWDAKPFPKDDRADRFVTLASGYAEDSDALPIRADARVRGASLKAGTALDLPLASGTHTYMVPARGTIEVNGVRVEARDGVAIADEKQVTIKALDNAEVILVETA